MTLSTVRNALNSAGKDWNKQFAAIAEINMASQHEDLVSIVIPTYNRASYIENAVKSIQNQTHTSWELLVCDDGSKDDTHEIMARITQQDPRVRYLRHNKNRGAQVARNAGIKAAKGEWVAFLDSDDEWLPESLGMRLSLGIGENRPVVHSRAYIIHPGDKKEIYDLPALSGKVHLQVLSGEGPVFPSLLVKRRALEQIGYLDESIVAYQEWETSIRLSKLFEFSFVPEPTFIYDYRTPNAISRDSTRAGRGYESIINKHRRDIVKVAGWETLWKHYSIAANWYKRGGARADFIRCKAISLFGKCLSPKRYARVFLRLVK